MILIIDSNVVFAALLKDSATRGLLIDSPFTFYAPETMLKEIRKYEGEICRRAGFKKTEFEILFSLITDNIEIVEKQKYEKYLKDADKLIGAVDKGDVPFLALALSMPNGGIWTQNAKHFERQKKIRIWATTDILRHLRDADL